MSGNMQNGIGTSGQASWPAPKGSTDQRRAQWIITTTVVGSYVVKVCLKLLVGLWTGSAPLIADAFHGAIDILEHFGLVIVGRHARKADPEKYPLGREPLLNLMSIAICCGVLLLSLGAIWQGIKSLAIAGGIVEMLPPLLADSLYHSDRQFVPPMIAPIVVMVFSSGLSWIVFKIEWHQAVKHRLKEFEADAKELRSDGILEMGIAVGLLTQWGLVRLVVEISWMHLDLDTVSRTVSGVIMIGLGGYILRHVLPDMREHYSTLLNPSISITERLALEDALQARMPIGCQLTRPVTAYMRGDSVFVTGWLEVERDLIGMGDVVTERCERIVEAYFSDDAESVNVHFGVTAVETEETIQQDWNRLLREVWNVDPNSDCAAVFRDFKSGELSVTRKKLAECELSNHQERSLATWMSAQVAFEVDGPASDELERAEAAIEKTLETTTSASIRGMLCSSRLIRAGSSTTTNPEKLDRITAFRDGADALLKDSAASPPVVRAECAFALGHSWNRAEDYDLDRATRYFDASARLYAESGIRSESDRLKTSWGHQKTLIYELGDSIILLEESRAIKELKGDRLGLAYVYGCLGDAYGRWGDFARAQLYYREDIRLIDELGITHQLPRVMVKAGEGKVRRGAVEREEAWIVAGIEDLENARAIVRDRDSDTTFFADKGCAKGALALASMCAAKGRRKQRLDDAHRILERMQPSGSYQEAFHERLLGRLKGLSEDNAGAAICLKNASGLFERLSSHGAERTMSMQSITCRLEAAKFQTAISGAGECIEEIVRELLEFIVPFRGLLGSAGKRIHEYVSEYRASGKKLTEKGDLTQIDALIAFLEG